MIFFTSDTHFSHFKICEYANRPFKTLEQMDETLIRNWNQRVKKEDTVFHLGDFCFSRSTEAPDGQKNKVAYEYYRNRLNGNIILTSGNHDSHQKMPSYIQSCQIKHGGKFINLVHNPERANPIYELNFCGHVHNRFKIQEKQIGCYTTTIVNVGVDVWNFMPITYSEIISAVIKYKKNLTSNP
jgi:calcineurin-like phosphoesterase family protein